MPRPSSLMLHAQALGLLAAAQLALWTARTPRVLAWTEDLARARDETPRRENPRRVAVAVGRAARWVPGATCLPQALVTRVLLARRGFGSATVRIGVARGDGDELEAHAWVELGGATVIGATERRFEPFPDYREALSAMRAAGNGSASHGGPRWV